MKEVGEYLKEITVGNDIKFREIAENDPKGAVELFGASGTSLDTANDRIKVDSSYAAEEIRDDFGISEIYGAIESATRVLDFADHYTEGRESALEYFNIKELEVTDSELRKRAQNKAVSNDRKAKAADTLFGLSLVGLLGSVSMNSVHGMGANTTAGVISSALSSRYQGGRDLSEERAAEGLADAYGEYNVEIV